MKIKIVLAGLLLSNGFMNAIHIGILRNESQLPVTVTSSFHPLTNVMSEVEVQPGYDKYNIDMPGSATLEIGRPSWIARGMGGASVHTEDLENIGYEKIVITPTGDVKLNKTGWFN